MWVGQNADTMLRCARPSLLVLVDSWEAANETNASMMGTNIETIEQAYRKVVDRFFRDRRVVVVRMRSVDAAAIIAPRSLDLVYIDGSHMYEHVLTDLMAWAPAVKTGGLLCGHDWNYFPDVNHAVREFLLSNEDWSLDYVTCDTHKPSSYGIKALR